MSEEVEYKHTCGRCGKGCNHLKYVGLMNAKGEWISQRMCSSCEMDLTKVVQ